MDTTIHFIHNELKKMCHYTQLWQMLADFQNSVTVIFSEKFATKLALDVWLHYLKNKTEIGEILLHLTQ